MSQAVLRFFVKVQLELLTSKWRKLFCVQIKQGNVELYYRYTVDWSARFESIFDFFLFFFILGCSLVMLFSSGYKMFCSIFVSSLFCTTQNPLVINTPDQSVSTSFIWFLSVNDHVFKVMLRSLKYFLCAWIWTCVQIMTHKQGKSNNFLSLHEITPN